MADVLTGVSLTFHHANPVQSRPFMMLLQPFNVITDPATPDISPPYLSAGGFDRDA